MIPHPTGSQQIRAKLQVKAFVIILPVNSKSAPKTIFTTSSLKLQLHIPWLWPIYLTKHLLVWWKCQIYKLERGNQLIQLKRHSVDNWPYLWKKIIQITKMVLRSLPFNLNQETNSCNNPKESTLISWGELTTASRLRIAIDLRFNRTHLPAMSIKDTPSPNVKSNISKE